MVTDNSNSIKINTYKCQCLIKDGQVIVTGRDKEPQDTELFTYDELRKLALRTQELGEANLALKDIASTVHPEGTEFTLNLQYVE